jgi:hypothetical protein
MSIYSMYIDQKRIKLSLECPFKQIFENHRMNSTLPATKFTRWNSYIFYRNDIRHPSTQGFILFWKRISGNVNFSYKGICETSFLRSCYREVQLTVQTALNFTPYSRFLRDHAFRIKTGTHLVTKL